MAKTYTKADLPELDRQLESMTDDELRALELAGSKLLRKGAEYDQAEYNRRYRQRIALAAMNKGMIQADEP